VSCFCLRLPCLSSPRPSPVSCSRLKLYPFPEPPNIPALKKLPCTSTDYNNTRSQLLLYHYPSTTRHIVIIFLCRVTSSFWLMSCFRVFSGGAFSGSYSIGDLVDSYANYCTIRRTPRSVLWKLISFSALHNVRERSS
jgi:hypothetical protein